MRSVRRISSSSRPEIRNPEMTKNTVTPKLPSPQGFAAAAEIGNPRVPARWLNNTSAMEMARRPSSDGIRASMGAPRRRENEAPSIAPRRDARKGPSAEQRMVACGLRVRFPLKWRGTPHKLSRIAALPPNCEGSGGGPRASDRAGDRPPKPRPLPVFWNQGRPRSPERRESWQSCVSHGRPVVGTSAVPPAAGKNAEEEPHPQFVIERFQGVAAKAGGHGAAGADQRLSVEVARHAEHMRHLAKIQRGPLRRLHVEARFLVEPGAADAAPVEPAAEVGLVQARCRDDVADDEFRRIEAADTRRARPDAPFPHFLSEQRARLAAPVRIPPTGAGERLPTERHVDAERHAAAELERLRAVVEERDHRPVP